MIAEEVNYKDSGVEWIGEIPEDWDLGKLKYLGQVGGGSTPKSDNAENWDGDINWVTTDDLGKLKDKFITKSRRKITSEGLKSIGNRISGPHTIIISCRAPIGHLGILSVEAANNQGCKAIIPDPDVDTFFLYYYLIAAKVDLQNKGNGTTFSEISTQTLKDYFIVHPPIQIQKSIATFLDRKTALIDALIEKKERMIKLLDEQRQATINQAVTCGLDKNGNLRQKPESLPAKGWKDSGVEWIGVIPEHWEVSRLDFLCTINGRVGWKALKADEYVEEGYIFLSTPNIKTSKIDFENVNYITLDRFNESPEIKLEIGDVLLAKDGSTLGITNVVRELPAPATVNSSIAVLKRKTAEIDSIFLYFFISSYYCQNIINQIKGGQGVPHLFQADIKKIVILKPLLKDQQLIADFLERFYENQNSLIKIQKEEIKKLKEYKSSLIFNAVTGKIQVDG